MKRLLFAVCVWAAWGTSDAQQPMQSTLFMFNTYAFNPAYAGLDNSLSTTAMFRQQWSGLQGNPNSQVVNAHLPVYYLRGGFGMQIENDMLGAETNTGFSMAYSYHLAVGKESTLAFGIGGGLFQKTLDGSALRTPDGVYKGTVNHNDNLLPDTKISARTFVNEAGLYFRSGNMQGGLSVKNVWPSKFNLEALRLSVYRNYFFNFAYDFELGNVVLRPALLAKSDLRQTQLDLAATAKFNDKLITGVSLRGYDRNSIDALGIIAGIKVSENLTLVYAYDAGLSKLKTVHNGSHEILLNYNLNKIIGAGTPPKIIYNPRFL